MISRLSICVYLTIGFLWNSIFHYLYVINGTARELRFALPFSGYGPYGPSVYGIVGALLVSALVFSVSWIFFKPINGFESSRLENPLGAIGSAVVLMLSILAISQFLAGASWSKLGFDLLVLITTVFMILVKINQVGFTQIFLFYFGMGGVILAMGGVWWDYKIEYQLDTFPTIAYFAIATIYVVVVPISLIIVDKIK